jgi:leucyl aminopeptidase
MEQKMGNLKHNTPTTLKIEFKDFKKIEGSTAVFFISEKLQLSPTLKKLDTENNKSITKAIKAAGYEGKSGKAISILGSVEGFDRVIVYGLGSEKEEKSKKEYDIQKLGAEVYSLVNGHKIKDAKIIIESSIYGFAPEIVAANIAFGTNLRSYRFTKYFVNKKEKQDEKYCLNNLQIISEDAKQSQAKYAKLQALADSVFLARNYVTEPPNVIYPESYADSIKEELSELGIKVEILGVKEMKKLGMNALLGVGQGSVQDSRLVVMQYFGLADKKSQPIAFVGKGVTFDTGGISIKPSDGMEDMKYDMGGSAAVVGTMRALAARKAKVNAVGVVGLVENMPDGNAQRPSDVVISMSGQSIEVLNTDAEGRLVLADALWYTQKNFNPKFMIDLATLTGAVTIALGQHKAGLMSNDDELAEQLYKTGEATGEHLWRLPLGDDYDRQIDSKIADMQNISNTKGGGTITAAQFLQRFVNDKKWAHLDIAGMAWTKKDKGLTPEGATGFGVRLLNKLVENYYEK